MTTKKLLLALAATSLLAFAPVAPVLAADDTPATDDGATMDVPADPDSADTGDMAPDPGTDDGAGDSSGMDQDPDAGGSEPAPQPD